MARTELETELENIAAHANALKSSVIALQDAIDKIVEDPKITKNVKLDYQSKWIAFGLATVIVDGIATLEERLGNVVEKWGGVNGKTRRENVAELST